MPLANTCVRIILQKAASLSGLNQFITRSSLKHITSVSGRSSRPAGGAHTRTVLTFAAPWPDVRPAFCLDLSDITGIEVYPRQFKVVAPFPFPSPFLVDPPFGLPPPAPSSPEQVLRTVVGHQSSPPATRGKKPIIGCDPTTRES